MQIQERLPRVLVWAALASVLVGCRSLSSYTFGPSPQAHELSIEGQVTPIARAQISALGFATKGESTVLRFRLRIENPKTEGLHLLRTCFELVDGRLTLFGAPDFHAAPGDAITRGGTILVDVSFPLPAQTKPADLDLSGIVLTWGVASPEQEYVTTATFQEFTYYYARYGYAYWGPYGYYHPGFGYTYPWYY